MKLLGQGGLWSVYKIENSNNIFRIPKSSANFSIDRFIKNHKLISDLGLPTLEKVEKIIIENKLGLICENVNDSEENIYVSFNSLYSDSQRQRDLISEKFLKKKIEKKSSLAEDFRYTNKLESILNFEEFLNETMSDLKFATKNDILIDFDSYFFGTKKNKSVSTIKYKLIDLDHIHTDTDKAQDELYELNISEFKKALIGFIKYFIQKNMQKKYLDILENKNYA